MRLSATAKWIGLALLGLAIAAAVAIAASNLVSRQIGIASESVQAGDALAPAVESAARRDGAGGDGPGTAPNREAENADAFEQRLDEREDALKDREDAREDLEDAQRDALEDRADD